MRVRMKTYGASRSGRALARELGILRLRTPTRFRPRNTDVIINWGDSNCEFLPMTPRVINPFWAVRAATDKRVALSKFKSYGIPCPEWTTKQEIANEWIESGSTVVGRSLTRGSGGRGISLYDSGTVPELPLYTKYVKKRDEYRVFVVGGKIVRVSQKRRRRGADVDNQVRNSDGGWVYCQEAVNAPFAVVDAGARAVEVLGLDFGAADVGYNAYYETACVYEVNTAFGLEGNTLKVVADAIREEYL